MFKAKRKSYTTGELFGGSPQDLGERWKAKMKGKESPKVEQVYAGYQDGEWANQFYAYRFKVDGTEVEVTTDLTRKGDWRVVWDGAVDYDGNKAGLLKRYPEFKKYLR